MKKIVKILMFSLVMAICLFVESNTAFAAAKTYLSSATIVLSQSSYTYDGSAKRPSVTVRRNGSIVGSSHYTVSYRNNVNAGTATVVVTAKSSSKLYQGSTSKTFTINKKSISSYSASVSPLSYTYNGSAKKPSVTVNGLGSNNYTVSYSNNINAGTAKVIITGKGNYNGSITKNFTINKKSISGYNASVSPTSYTYDGSAKKPSVTVSGLGSGNYTVSYSNNISAGTAKVTITGKGNYNGSITKNFTINKQSISGFSVTMGAISYTYDGSAKRPTVVLKKGSTTIAAYNYTVSYSNNINAGTAKVIITGKGNYNGSITKNFTINKKSISGYSASVSPTSYTYDGSAKKPSVTVTGLGSGNYTVSYSNNVNAGTAKVTITGKGNYNGSITKNFTIKPKSLSPYVATLSTTSYVYNGDPKKPTVTVKGLTSSNYTVSYSNNVNVGTATATVTGKGNYNGTIKKTFKITVQNIKNVKISNLDRYMMGIDSTLQFSYNGKTLKSGVDYSNNKALVTVYKFNTSQGKIEYQVTYDITGKGNFTGKLMEVAYGGRNVINTGKMVHRVSSEYKYAFINNKVNKVLDSYLVKISDSNIVVNLNATTTLKDGTKLPFAIQYNNPYNNYTYRLLPGSDYIYTKSGKTYTITGIDQYTGTRTITVK